MEGSRLQIASQRRIKGVGEYPGIGGRIKSEWVGALNRNRWAHHPGIRTGWVSHTALGISLAGLAAVPVILFVLGLRGRRGGLCFAATTIAIAIGLVALVASVFPFLIPPSLTILDAAAPDASLGFLLIGAAVLLPLILAYTAFTYWVFLREERAETK